MNADAIAARFNVPRRHIYQWASRGKLPVALREGRSLWFDPEEIKTWADQQKGHLPGRRGVGGMLRRTMYQIEAAKKILEEHQPQTVRQIFYRLVSAQILKNTPSQYQGLSDALVNGRKHGLVPWGHIEDRTRRPRPVLMWPDIQTRMQMAAENYRRDVWQDQPGPVVTVWLEKDALASLFEDILYPYGVTLYVGKGYQSWSSVREAAEVHRAGKSGLTAVYFGDFDPSGEDMVRFLRDTFAFFDCSPDIEKAALTLDDITTYSLPPDTTKPRDTRRGAHIAKYGDVAVELDALPAKVLEARLISAVESRMNLNALAKTQRKEARERREITASLSGKE